MANSIGEVIARIFYKNDFDSLNWVDSNHDDLPQRGELTSKGPDLPESVYDYFYTAKLRELTEKRPSHEAKIELHGNEYANLLSDNGNFLKTMKGSLAYRYYDRIYLMVNYVPGRDVHLVTLVATKGKNVTAVQENSKDPDCALIKILEKLDIGKVAPSQDWILSDKVILLGEEAPFVARDKQLRMIANTFDNLDGLDRLVVVINRISTSKGDLYPVMLIQVKEGVPIRPFEPKETWGSVIGAISDAVIRFNEQSKKTPRKF